MEAATAQRPPAQQPDATTLAALVVILLSGQSAAAMRDLAAPILAPYGIGAQALGEVLELLVPHLSEGGAFALPAAAGRFVPRSARGWTQRTAFARHASYFFTAAQRVARGGSIDAERRYMTQHFAAERTRRQAAGRVDDAASRYGDVLGWNAVNDHRTTPECRAADGSNFSAVAAPAIGYPGTLHGGSCRCRPGPPHPSGGMLE